MLWILSIFNTHLQNIQYHIPIHTCILAILTVNVKASATNA